MAMVLVVVVVMKTVVDDVVVDLEMLSVWWSAKQHLTGMCAFYVVLCFFVAVRQKK